MKLFTTDYRSTWLSGYLKGYLKTGKPQGWTTHQTTVVEFQNFKTRYIRLSD